VAALPTALLAFLFLLLVILAVLRVVTRYDPDARPDTLSSNALCTLDARRIT